MKSKTNFSLADKEKSLKAAYKRLLEVGFGEGSLENVSEFIDENVMGYGTAQDEKITSIQDFRDLIIDQREQAVNFDEFSFTSKPVISRISDNGNTAVVVDEIVLLTRFQGESNELAVRMSTIFEFRDGSWKLIHWHGSKPEHISGGDDPWHVDEWKKKNAVLQKAVEEKTADLLIKNRELEIETALEKVRTIAMGMRKPDDMLDVCKTISLQLHSLGVKEIRNVQTAIFYEQRGTYMNYEYYAKHDKTFITETSYTNHEMHKEFAAKMLKGKRETFITHINGDDVKDWINYQKTTNVFIDEYLETASSLNYYWFSLGPVALGISTYILLTEAEIYLFKRFLKVFELAYQRYLDIEIAVAQAREAEIELALERVRVRTMAMQKSEELNDVVMTLFGQMKDLEIDVDAININILNDDLTGFDSWFTAPGYTKAVCLYTPYFDTPVMNDIFNAVKSKQDLLSKIYPKEEKDAYFSYLYEHSDYKDLPDERKKMILAAEGWCLSVGIANNIGISIHSYSDRTFSEKEHDILKRFAKVFEPTYTRFLDLKKAEAQAREAQIELALERVRSRSMGMQKSEELKDVIQIVYEQFAHLNILVEHAGFVMDYKIRDDYNIWVADPLGVPAKITIPYFDSVYYNRFNEAKEKGEDFFATNLSFEEKNRFYQKLFEYIPGLPAQAKEFYFSCPGLAGSTVLLENVGLYIENFSGIPYSDDENATLMRFGKVFQQTYTRFLDLQKAEAQAREAQIEAALERVRSRTMAMQRSEELLQVITILAKQFQLLNFNFDNVSFAIRNQTHDYNFWISATGLPRPYKIHVPYLNNPMFERIRNVQNNNLSIYTDTLSIEESRQWHQHVFENSIFKYLPEKTKDYILNNNYTRTIVFMPTIMLIIGNYASIIYTEEENNIFRRFAVVFEQSYTRFLDLQKAESQAREAKIEAALEKVRSRTMAMQKSEELAETAAVLFQQLNELGYIPDRITIGIMKEDVRSIELWSTDQVGNQITHIFKPSIDEPTTWSKIYGNWKAKKRSVVIDLSGLELNEWIRYVREEMQMFINEDVLKENRRVHSVGFFSQGFIMMSTIEALSVEKIDVLERFSLVFNQTYTRFLDLQKAEAQAREAQIEAALERVRAKTLAMQQSDELTETSAVVFKQLINLGIEPNRIYIAIIKDETEVAEFWVTDEDGSKVSTGFTINLNENISFRKMYSGWKEQKKSIILDLQGEELEKYFSHLSRLNVPFKEGFSQKRRIQNIAYFTKGFIGVASPDETKPETIQLLERFAAVFNLTYTRFNDLKQAEAQNRIIQAENERKTKELEDARQLQLSMLPKELPKLPHLDIAVYMKTATEVGGDYYDFNVDDNGTLTILAGDATGHGMMSGMMVSIMKSFFISNRKNIELKQFFENSNNSIKEMHLGRLMMPLIGVQINSEKLIATNAGMPSLIYFRNKSQKAGEFVSNNLPLGGMKNTNYSLKEIRYEMGDTLLLMSDGFAELKNENNEQYGYTRVKEEFRSVAQKSPNEIIGHLKDSASQWINGIEPDDDVSFVVIKFK